MPPPISMLKINLGVLVNTLLQWLLAYMSSASSPPDPHHDSALGLRWGTSVPVPCFVPRRKKFLATPLAVSNMSDPFPVRKRRLNHGLVRLVWFLLGFTCVYRRWEYFTWFFCVFFLFFGCEYQCNWLRGRLESWKDYSSKKSCNVHDEWEWDLKLYCLVLRQTRSSAPTDRPMSCGRAMSYVLYV